MTDVLLVVAVRTDQPEIARRIQAILAASQPIESQGTCPCAFAKPVDELTANDYDDLCRIFHPDDIDRLNIGSVWA